MKIYENFYNKNRINSLHSELSTSCGLSTIWQQLFWKVYKQESCHI